MDRDDRPFHFELVNDNAANPVNLSSRKRPVREETVKSLPGDCVPGSVAERWDLRRRFVLTKLRLFLTVTPCGSTQNPSVNFRLFLSC